MARFDRCTTCHQGIAEPDRGFPQPFSSHPRLDLYLGSHSPHPVDEFGCTICHDGQGSATSFRWASHTPNALHDATRWRREHAWQPTEHWEWPMLPRRFLESRCLQCHHEVTDLEPSDRYPDAPAPRLLAGYHLIRENGCFGCHDIDGYDAAGRRIGPDMRLEPSVAAATDGPPGTLRKAGPSLRDVAQKLTPAMAMDRTADPRLFLPQTRMPRLFGLHAHLTDPAHDDAHRFEPVEIQAIVAYLWSVSESIEPLPAAGRFAEDASPARGRNLFQMQGCLACHQHEAFPEGQSAVGPDLSRIGAKYATDSGKAWLRDLLLDPTHRSPRTPMPHVPLEPVRWPQADGEPAEGPDPVADVMAFLLDVPPYAAAAPDYRPADLDELVLQHLTRVMPQAAAVAAWREGLSESEAQALGGDTELLVGRPSLKKKLRYVGKRTVAKRGCYGCHDIPGFDDAPPIGPALTDWGRKRETLLAFEQIDRYLDEVADDTAPFFTEAIRRRRREGFLWQKLREPRSFDYRQAAGKPFNEWLTMGQFDFTPEQREAVMTFVLGLTADPPRATYVHAPEGPRRAVVKGRHVLDRFACAECHTLRMEQWSIAYDPDRFDPPPPHDDFDWLLPRFSQEEIEASRAVDDRGLARATLTGMPRLDDEGRIAIVDDDMDEEGNELLLHAFTLWEPAVLAGEPIAVGGADVLVWHHQIERRRPAWGGELARMLYPAALAEARAAGAQAIGPEAWGWLPPPLPHTGKAVQPSWLHEYLQRPYVIRPAAMLRMPHYHLSPEEAGKLVDFFKAAAGAELPYTGAPSPRRLRDEPLTADRRERFGEAMRMLLDTQAYCARCHRIGDYTPGEAVPVSLAPDLAQVAPRLQAEFLYRWLASPASVLPYTVMPANFPPTGRSLDPIRFPGDSVEQLERMTDLLLNYDWYLKQQQSIRERIDDAGTAAADSP